MTCATTEDPTMPLEESDSPRSARKSSTTMEQPAKAWRSRLATSGEATHLRSSRTDSSRSAIQIIRRGARIWKVAAPLRPPRYLGGYTKFLRERVTPVPSGIQKVVIVIALTGFRLALRLAGMTK